MDWSGADVMVDVIKSLRLSLREQTGAIQNAVQCRGSRIVHEHKGKTDFGSVQQAEPPIMSLRGFGFASKKMDWLSSKSSVWIRHFRNIGC
jgi:hypothetical protein